MRFGAKSQSLGSLVQAERSRTMNGNKGWRVVRSASILVVGAISFCLSACDKTPSVPRSAPRKIAFVVTTLSNPFFVDMIDGAKLEAAKHSDVELLVQAPDRALDNERQIQIIENLITQKVDIICVVPANSKSIIAAVEKANKAGIPIVNIDNKIDSALAREKGVRIATFVGSDNFGGGKLAGQFVAERLGTSGTVAILEGVSGVEAAIQRKEGFLEAIKTHPGIKLVASQPADWEREKGLNVFQGIFQANPNLGALFACNDEMALGALRALKEPRKTLVVGFDATKDALDAIKEGKMDATVAQQPSEMGRVGIRTAVAILKGEKIEPVILTDLRLETITNPGG